MSIFDGVLGGAAFLCGMGAELLGVTDKVLEVGHYTANGLRYTADGIDWATDKAQAACRSGEDSLRARKEALKARAEENGMTSEEAEALANEFMSRIFGDKNQKAESKQQEQVVVNAEFSESKPKKKQRNADKEEHAAEVAFNDAILL